MYQQPEFELGAARLIPALPRVDPQDGPVEWSEWEEIPTISHIPGNCTTCEYPGPLRLANGFTWTREKLTWVRVARSGGGQPSQWRQRQTKSRRLRTHYAVRCPHCDEMRVYRKERGAPGGAVVMHYHPPAEAAPPPAPPQWPRVSSATL